MKDIIYKKLDRFKYIKFNKRTKEKEYLSLDKFKKITNTDDIKRISEEEFIRESPDYILLIGMSASGKSTLANKLQDKKDYLVISLDDIIRKIAKDHPMKEKIYGVYRGKYPEVREKIISNLRKTINSFKKVIIEGAIFSREVIDDILKISQQLKLYYKEPVSNSVYNNQITRRVLSDIKNNTLNTNFLWSSLDKKDIEYAFNYKKLNSNIKNKIKRHVKMRIHYLVEDYKIFEGLKYYIIV